MRNAERKQTSLVVEDKKLHYKIPTIFHCLEEWLLFYEKKVLKGNQSEGFPAGVEDADE